MLLMPWSTKVLALLKYLSLFAEKIKRLVEVVAIGRKPTPWLFRIVKF